MTGRDATEKADKVVASLEELHARLSDEDRGTVEHVKGFIAEVMELLSTMDGQLAAMRFLAQKQFRPKADKAPEGQLTLDLLGFLLGQRGVKEDNTPPEPKDPPPSPHKPEPREKRKSKLHLIPVVTVRKELPEAERICGCCNVVKTEFDVEPRRTLMYEPAKLYFREEHLVKYACRACGLGVTTAPATPKLIEGSHVGSSVLAHLVVAKVLDATPVERVGRQWARHGYDIAPSTMHEWFGRCGRDVDFLGPIAREQVRSCSLVSFDDTPMPAKIAGHEGSTKRGRLWMYIGDLSKVAYCEFSSDWKGSHPCGVLQGFSGHIQSDGYGGVASLFAAPAQPNKVGCNDHCRRKYVDALKLGDDRAAKVVALYGELYAVEREGKSMTPDQRLRLRTARSVPLWAQLSTEVVRLEHLAQPKSPLAKANTYFRRQNAALSAFLSHGALPISNVHVERLLRSVALFRKNSLFVGSEEAGKRYAALLTLAVNCTLSGANPFDYFTQLFDNLAAKWPRARAYELMPQAWLAHKQAQQLECNAGLDADHG